MPRLRYVKPACRSCGERRYMGCYLGRWLCHNPFGHGPAMSRNEAG